MIHLQIMAMVVVTIVHMIVKIVISTTPVVIEELMILPIEMKIVGHIVEVMTRRLR